MMPFRRQATQPVAPQALPPVRKQMVWLKALALGFLPLLSLIGFGLALTAQQTAQSVVQQQQRQAVQTSELLTQLLQQRHQEWQGLLKFPGLAEGFIRPAKSRQGGNTGSIKAPQTLLENLQQTYPNYSSFAVFDPQGNLLQQTGNDRWTNPAEAAYFQTALATNTVVMGSPETIAGKRIITWVAPIPQAQTGEVVAMIAGRMPLDHLLAQLPDRRRVAAQWYLIDGAGQQLLDPLVSTQGKAAPVPVWHDRLGANSTLVSTDLNWGLAMIGRSQPQHLAAAYAIGSASVDRVAHQALAWRVVYAAEPQAVVELQRSRLWLLLFSSLGLLILASLIVRLIMQRAQQSVALQVTALQVKEQQQQAQQLRQAERSQWSQQIVESMRQSMREEDILNTTVTELRYALKTDRVVVYRFHDDWHGTVIAESVAVGQKKILGETVQDPFREGLIERYRNGRVRAMNDVKLENLTQCHEDILAGFEIQASIVAPIVRSGELIGLLCAHECTAPRQWEVEDIELFRQLSSQLGFVLEQAAVLQRLSIAVDRSRLINEIVSAMRRSLQEEAILNTTVSELRYALKTDRVIVYRFDDNWNGTIIAESAALTCEKILGRTVHDPFREGLIERYRNGRVRSMNDINAEEITDCHRALLEGFQIRASIVAPILQNGELIGLLCAHECGGPRQWEMEDIDLFAKLAIQLGYALEQAATLQYAEQARREARQEADAKAAEQQQAREKLQLRARELLQEVTPVSQGDLTVKARVTEDEVGTIADTYNRIIQSLRQIVTQVQATSTSVAETASHNESAVSGLSNEAKKQMDSLKETLRHVELMVDAMAGIADRAKHAELSVQVATETLSAGDAAMNRTVSGMSAIRETVSETAKKVKRLGEASQKISRVVSLINGFSAQTNMLALNATIEASKAGEEGQGFGIVAEKVRLLAQQSTAATAEIEQLVLEIQSQTNEVVTAMETGTDQVVMGTQLVEESRQHLSQISQAGHHISKLVQEIAQVSEAQTGASQLVSQKMQQMTLNADSTSQQAESVAESFQHLLAVANALQVSVAQFKVK